MTPGKTTAIRPEPFTTRAGRLLCAAEVALVTACGGGGEPTPMLPAPQPPAPAYSVVVKAVDTQGQPIAGASVSLNGGFNGMTAMTGSDGATTFKFNAWSADASLRTYMTGYHSARREFLLGGANSPNVQQLQLMRTDEAQLVLRGVTSQASADASSVVVSADIGVADHKGDAIATLTAADFTVPDYDCGWAACVLDPSGAMLNGWWSPSRTTPVEATLSGTGPSTHYKVRFVLEAVPGMFTAGRTVLTSVDVHVGADTWVGIELNVPL